MLECLTTVFRAQRATGVMKLTQSPSCVPRGHYCENGTGPIDCPRLLYSDELGGESVADCLSCEAGYWCNMTGKQFIAASTITLPSNTHVCIYLGILVYNIQA